MREPFLLAFSTASSEAAYPQDDGAAGALPGHAARSISFVLPMGYSFNLDGSMMYCTFATMFIAQAYNIQLPLGQQITMLLLLMLTSKGMAGVPRASLVVIAATLSSFNIPEAGLLLIIGIDQFLDMGRSATNVIGNSLATAVVAKWEGERCRDRCGRPSAQGSARRMNRLTCAAVLLLTLAVPAWAQDWQLSGTLAKIRASGKITLGVRDFALPFSYKLPNGVPAGYAVELCQDLVEDISTELDGMDVAIVYRTVTADNRIAMVAVRRCRSGVRIDHPKQGTSETCCVLVRCSSSPAPSCWYRASHRFGLTGTWLVKQSSSPRARPMRQRCTLWWIACCCTSRLSPRRNTRSHSRMLRDGKADAFATDDVLLAGLAATRQGVDYHVVGDYLSYDPYGLMYRQGRPGIRRRDRTRIQAHGRNGPLVRPVSAMADGPASHRGRFSTCQ